MADPAVVPVEALRALVDKLPMFDPQWPDDLREQWIAAFRTLMGFVLNQADALLAASASTPGPAPCEHTFVTVELCSKCWRTEADIEGTCHHCDEPQPSARCWWCGRKQLRALAPPARVAGSNEG